MNKLKNIGKYFRKIKIMKSILHDYMLNQHTYDQNDAVID